MDVEAGSDLLKALDRGLARLREDLLELDRTVQASSGELLELGKAELAAYKRLAELRLEQLKRGGLVSSLDAVSQRVRDLLARRDEALALVGRKLEEAEQRLAPLEEERERQRSRVETAAALLDQREAEVQERLAADPDYQARLARARDADAIADRAEQKTADAESDRAAKGQPYEADPLFMYLWRRGYGTSAYRGRGLTRMLDRWVARVTGYDKARPNYWMLQEIPVRLRAHAERVRAAATEAFEALKALERRAAEEAGVPALRAALAEEEKKLDELDERIAATEQSIAALMEQRAAFAAGEDEAMQSALAMLAAELRSEGIERLRRHAAATPTDEDDRVVAQIIEYEEERERLEDRLRQNKALHERHRARVRELEDVRRRFKEHRYDDLHSIFIESPLLMLALNEFLRGIIGGQELWKTLRRHQRFREVRSRPTFGSGGFPGRIGSWHLPRGGGWSFPRSGGFGGGGFKTGGGFGRGGFKTGGGF